MGFIMDFFSRKNHETTSKTIWEKHIKVMESLKDNDFYIKKDVHPAEDAKPGFVRYVEHRRSSPCVRQDGDNYRINSVLSQMALYLASDVPMPSNYHSPSSSSCDSLSSSSEYSSPDSCSGSSYDSGSSICDSGSSSDGGGSCGGSD